MQVNQPIENLLPHRHSMLLIDSLHKEDRINELGEAYQQLTAIARFKRDSLFATKNGIPTIVAMELMAQSFAAMTSFNDRHNQVKSGMLLMVKNLTMSAPYFAFDQAIEIRCQAINDDSPMKMVQCDAMSDSAHASAVLTVIQQAE